MSSLCGRHLEVPPAHRGRLPRRRFSCRSWLWCVLLLLVFCVLLLSATGGDAGGKAKKPPKKASGKKGGAKGGKKDVQLTPTPLPAKPPGDAVPALGARAPEDIALATDQPATPNASPADAQFRQDAVVAPQPMADGGTLERTRAIVDEFFSRHALVVRALGGIARTLERCQSGKARRSAVEDVRQQLDGSFTLDALHTTAHSIGVMMDGLAASGLCSTFYHCLPTGSKWVVNCWTGLLDTYHKPTTFVTPHALLGWPVPTRTARLGWDWLALDPLPPLTRRHRTIPVENEDAQVRDKQRDRLKKAKDLAKARSKVVKEYAKVVKAAQKLRDEAAEQFSHVKPEEETAAEYEQRLKLAEKVQKAAKKRAEEDRKQVLSKAEKLLDDASHSSPAQVVKAKKIAAGWIRNAESAKTQALAQARKAYEAAVADALKRRTSDIKAIVSAGKAVRSAAYAEALAMEARARTAMDEAIAKLELEYKDAILPPPSRRISVAPAAALELSLGDPAASRATFDFDLQPAEPTEVLDAGLTPVQPSFFFEAPPDTTNLQGMSDESFQEQYLPYGYGMPFDSEMCAHALNSVDLCAYMCCQTRMLGTAICDPLAGCF